jgi:hypothetical protein
MRRLQSLQTLGHITSCLEVVVDEIKETIATAAADADATVNRSATTHR